MEGDFKGVFKQDMSSSGQVRSRSGLVKVWSSLQPKFNSFELDSEVGRLVVLGFVLFYAELSLAWAFQFINVYSFNCLTFITILDYKKMDGQRAPMRLSLFVVLYSLFLSHTSCWISPVSELCIGYDRAFWSLCCHCQLCHQI